MQPACVKIGQIAREYILKIRLLISLLVVSLLLNVAGLVFFILYLSEKSHSKSSRKQKAALEQKLAALSANPAMIENGRHDLVQTRTFASLSDGRIDNYAFQPPQTADGFLEYTLLVYLHGMGSNYMEPFLIPAQTSIAGRLTSAYPRLGLVSCSYRKEASWGNDVAVQDIIQNIREVASEYPFKKIVLMGTSMGGCVCLNFAATAPPDIKEKIVGAVCVEGAGDLKELFYSTSTDALRPAMMIAYGGSPKEIPHVYKEKSFLSHLDKLNSTSRIYVISARQDKVVPPEFQRQICQELSKRSISNQLQELDQSHEAPAADEYLKGLEYVLMGK